jgi:hypothetical protein
VLAATRWTAPESANWSRESDNLKTRIAALHGSLVPLDLLRRLRPRAKNPLHVGDELPVCWVNFVVRASVMQAQPCVMLECVLLQVAARVVGALSAVHENRSTLSHGWPASTTPSAAPLFRTKVTGLYATNCYQCLDFRVTPWHRVTPPKCKNASKIGVFALFAGILDKDVRKKGYHRSP